MKWTWLGFALVRASIRRHRWVIERHLAPAGGAAGLRLGSPLHETGRPGVERLEGCLKVSPRLFALRVQAFGLEDPPVAHQRHDHVVMVDAKVVDACLGDL